MDAKLRKILLLLLLLYSPSFSSPYFMLFYLYYAAIKQDHKEKQHFLSIMIPSSRNIPCAPVVLRFNEQGHPNLSHITNVHTSCIHTFLLNIEVSWLILFFKRKFISKINNGDGTTRQSLCEIRVLLTHSESSDIPESRCVTAIR